MMLFICHAWEDKDDFVAPLAAELRKKYKVWYDDYALTLGDSLPEKIDDGLKRCDFGIVVLSKAFFAKKKWARKELDGLIALEVKRGKMILPVLKGVTHDDVEKYSPMLASKLSVSDSEGLPKVVEKIELAVSVSNRQRELTALDTAAQSVEALRQSIEEDQRAKRLSRSDEGAALVKSSIDTMWETMQRVFYVDPNSSASAKFRCVRQVWNTMFVATVHGMHLKLYVAKFYDNSVVDTRLEIKIFRQEWDEWRQPRSDVITQLETEFEPTFGPAGGDVVWLNQDKTAKYTSEDLAAYLIEVFTEHVRKEITSGKD